MLSIDNIRNWYHNFILQFPEFNVRDAVEIIIIAFIVYQVILWFRGTRAWMLIKGIVVLAVISAFAMIFELNTILWIFSKTLNVGIIAVIIVFQPELRRALESLGRRNLMNSFNLFEDNRMDENHVDESIINEIVDSVEEMSKVKTGALIVIEQNIPLTEYERTGIAIEAVVSRQLLTNIFEHNTPLHDGAVIIRGKRVIAATCYLPLSDNMTLSKELGTRHRAGVGISEVSDAIVIIVSEETGNVSVALGGNLVRGVSSEYLKNKLLHIYTKTVEESKFVLWKGWGKNGKSNNK